MSFSMESLRSALSIPSTRTPIDGATLISHVFPPVICSFLIAVLAVTPQTRTIRLALWPVVALLAMRAALSVDLSFGKPEREFLNIDMVASVFRSIDFISENKSDTGFFQLSMVYIGTRTLEWSLAKEPFVRYLRPAKCKPSTIMDALDLVSNLRGHGWEWARGAPIPRETRPVDRSAFLFYTLLSALAHALICGALHRAVLSLAPGGTGLILEGSTIFDDSLPFLIRYLRAGMISTLCAFAIYAVLQMAYDLMTIPAILVLGQDPAQWPPAFDAPWCATSLSDFWGRRWHQWFRQTFLLLGSPFAFLFGTIGRVVGAFLASAVFHHIAMSTLNGQIEFRWMLVGFGMMAPGIIAERAFYRLTGKKVGGVMGWIWTMTWLLLWGTLMVEGFARAGMFGCSSFIDSALPVRIWIERLVIDLDAWLHTF